MIVQDKLIAWILRPLSNLTGSLSENARKFIVLFSIFGMVLVQFAYNSGMVSHFIVAAGLLCIFIGLIILAGLTKEIHPIEVSRPILFCWMGFALWVFLSGVLVEHNNLADAMIFLLGFPIMWLVWSQYKSEILVSGVYWGVTASFGAFLIIGKIWFPITGIHYQAFMGNPNSLSLYCCAIIACAVSQIFCSNKFTGRRITAMIVNAAAFGILVFTSSRTGLVCTKIIFISCTVLAAIRGRKKLVKMLTCQLVPALLVCFLVIPVMGPLMEPIQFDLPWTDPSDSTAIGDETEETIKRPSYMDAVRFNESRFEGEDEDLNSYTSGRVDLWKLYLKEVGLLGNSDSKELRFPDGRLETRSSHFTLIQLAYKHGAVSAVFFLIFNILAGLKALELAVRKNNEPWTLFPVVIALAYGSSYLMESIVTPSTVLLPALYMISITMLIQKRDHTKAPAVQKNVSEALENK